MTDDVKDAVEWLRSVARGGFLDEPGLAEAILAHLDAVTAERDELRQRIFDSCPSPDEGGRIHAGGRVVCGQCHDSEVRHLMNERDALRAQVERVRALADRFRGSGASLRATPYGDAMRAVLDALEGK